MNHTPSLKQQTAAHARQSGRDMCPRRCSRELIVGLTCLLMLTGTLAQGQEDHDALFIDKDGSITIGKSLQVKEEMSVIGTVRAKKFEGDGSAITVGGVELVKQVKSTLPLTLEEVVRAMIADLVPIGTIMAYGGDVRKQEIIDQLGDEGWLVCNGNQVKRNEYPELFKTIGGSFGVGDGKTTFLLPDMRGQFLRGVDHNRGMDTDASSRSPAAPGGNRGDAVGSVQNDQFRQHKHPLSVLPPVMCNVRAGTYSGGKHGKYYNFPRSTEMQGGSETRPKNIYVNWIIKAKHIIR